MTTCQRELREAGVPYPRTCERCGLFGRCYIDSVPQPLPPPSRSTITATVLDARKQLDILADQFDKLTVNEIRGRIAHIRDLLK